MWIFATVSALALFLPTGWLNHIHVDSAIDRYRPGIWLVFSICVIGLLTYPLYAIDDKRKEVFLNRKIKRRLQMLAEDEKDVLALFLKNKVSSCGFIAYQPGASSLVDAGIIYPSSTIGARGPRLYYTIHSWIYHYLMKHPNLCEKNPN
jgi:hypothetical protein